MMVGEGTAKDIQQVEMGLYDKTSISSTCKGTLREAPVSSQYSRVRVLSQSHG